MVITRHTDNIRRAIKSGNHLELTKRKEGPVFHTTLLTQPPTNSHPAHYYALNTHLIGLFFSYIYLSISLSFSYYRFLSFNFLSDHPIQSRKISEKNRHGIIIIFCFHRNGAVLMFYSVIALLFYGFGLDDSQQHWPENRTIWNRLIGGRNGNATGQIWPASYGGSGGGSPPSSVAKKKTKPLIASNKSQRNR